MPFDQHLSIFPSSQPLGGHQHSTLFFSEFDFLIFYMSQRSYSVSVSVWCISLNTSNSIHAVATGRISFFSCLNSIPLNGQFLKPFICWLILRLHAWFGYYEWDCKVHWRTDISLRYQLHFLWLCTQEWDCWIIVNDSKWDCNPIVNGIAGSTYLYIASAKHNFVFPRTSWKWLSLVSPETLKTIIKNSFKLSVILVMWVARKK